MMTSADSEHTVNGYLAADHDRLDDLLVEVTDLIAAGDFDQADRILARFASGLRRHIRLEDDVLFPTFEQVTGMASGPTTVMRDEHRAIEQHLDALVTAVEHRDRATFSTERAAMLAVLGDHNAKEEAIIYPMTDANLPDAQRVQLVARLRAFR